MAGQQPAQVPAKVAQNPEHYTDKHLAAIHEPEASEERKASPPTDPCVRGILIDAERKLLYTG
jgi:hypothetical protein